MKKSDVQFHRDGYGPSHPAINVKVRNGSLEQGVRAFHAANPEIPERFTENWIRANVPQDALDNWWNTACQSGFELAESDAQEIFGKHVKVYSEGRSSGWLIVEGLPDFDTWNAPMLAKWAKFSRYCEAYVKDIPYQTVDLIYYNVFKPAEQEQDAVLAKG